MNEAAQPAVRLRQIFQQAFELVRHKCPYSRAAFRCIQQRRDSSHSPKRFSLDASIASIDIQICENSTILHPSHSILVALCAPTSACSDDNSGDDDIGDGGDGGFNGVYVDCQNANGSNYYYQFKIPCPSTNQIEGCYSPVVPNDFEVCVGPGNISGFTYAEWDNIENTFPSYDTNIRTLCTNLCENNNTDGTPSCSNSGWTDHWTKAGWTPDDGYNCTTQYQPLITDPNAANIAWTEGASTISIPLECSLFDDCPDYFDAHIDQWTQIHKFGGVLNAIDVSTRQADYLGSDEGSILAIDMSAGDGPSYDDAHALVAFGEYTASDCGESTCPFYLANFGATNSSDSWDIWVSWASIVSEAKHIENVHIEAWRSSLGAWRPSNGQVAFPAGSIVLNVSFDVSSDCVGCSGLGDGSYTFPLVNKSAIYGNFSDGTLSFSHTFDVLGGGTATLSVELDAEQHPPEAVVGIGSQTRCNDANGYVLSAFDSLSTDPDSDIDYEIWIVDGVAEGNGTTIPLGTHTVGLTVVDDRGAQDAAGEQSVKVIAGPACL